MQGFVALVLCRFGREASRRLWSQAILGLLGRLHCRVLCLLHHRPQASHSTLLQNKVGMVLYAAAMVPDDVLDSLLAGAVLGSKCCCLGSCCSLGLSLLLLLLFIISLPSRFLSLLCLLLLLPSVFLLFSQELLLLLLLGSSWLSNFGASLGLWTLLWSLTTIVGVEAAH